MKISGIQKLTLLDFPGRVACTIFTPGCNLRCPFCHNASLVFNRADEISEEEVLDFLKKRAGILDGICITGGEPLLQKDIAQFIRRVRKLGYLVKLDTNGTFPGLLGELLQEKLVDYVAMDIKSSRKNYHIAAGTDSVAVDRINESINLLRSSGIAHEFRTTTVKGIHTKEDFEDIAEWLENGENYFIQQYKVSDSMIGDKFESFSKEELDRFREIAAKKVRNVSLRGI